MSGGYRNLRPGNILGIGNIPSEWDIKKIKHLFSIGRGRVISQEELEDNGRYPVYSSQTNNNGCLGYISSYDFNCRQLTWTTDGANAGTVFLREGKHNCTNVCGTLQLNTKSAALDFSAYSLHYMCQFHKRPDTNGAKIMNNEMAEISIPLPSISEQNQIAAYLDHQTARIDTLIDKQNQLIELLKEKRQAVISHAVTKGLNPHVTMKDSGVEWLGEVPEHWGISNLGYNTFKIGSGKTPRGGADIYQDSGILFLRSQNVHDNGLRINISECVYINKLIHSEMYSTRVIPGDILLNITGGSIGRSCLVPDDFVESNVNQHVCILRLPDYLRVFLSFFMKSDAIQNQIEALQTGGNREGLNFEQISKLRICLPSHEEIVVINEYVKEKLSIFEQSELLAVNAISLLKERRTALISAAVTGKIDVRHWRAPQVVSESKIPEATA